MDLDPEQVMRTYLVEVALGGRTDLIDELALPDMVDEANQAFGGPPGRAGLVAHVVGFRRNIADVELTIHQVVGGDDQVMAWWSFTGTHVGPWLAVPATGGPVTATVFSFFDLVGGRISRYRLWLHTDLDGGMVLDTAATSAP